MAYTAHADTFARNSLPPKSQWPDLMFELPLLRATELRQIIDKVVAPAVNLFLAPALDQVMPDANLVEHARDDEIDYRRHTLRPVVEARVRGEDDGAGVRELEHGLEMDG